MPPKATGGKAKRKATATTSSSEEVAPANTTPSNDNNEAAGSIATTSSAQAAPAQAGPSQPAPSTGVVTRSSARRGNATQEHDNEKSETHEDEEPDAEDSGSEYEGEGTSKKKASKKKPAKKVAGKERPQTGEVGEPGTEEHEGEEADGKKKVEEEKEWHDILYIEGERGKKRAKEYRVRWTSTWVKAKDVRDSAKIEWEQRKTLPDEVTHLKNGELILVSALTPNDIQHLETSFSAGPSLRRLTADEEAEDGGDQSVPEQQEEIGDTAHEAEQDGDGDQPEIDQEEIGKVTETPGPYTPPTSENKTQLAFDWFECSKKYLQAELEYHLFAQPLLDWQDSPDQRLPGRIILPHHRDKDKEKFGLWMSHMQPIPQAFRTDLENDRPAPEKEVLLTIMTNPPDIIPANAQPHISCHGGALCIRGLENLQRLDSSSARPRPPLEKLMRFLTEALTSQVRIIPYNMYDFKGSSGVKSAMEKSTDEVAGNTAVYIGGGYLFQKKQARFTPNGDIEWYQPALPGRPSNVDSSEMQGEINKHGANTTGAGEDGNDQIEAMDVDESDAAMHDASRRNSAERSESAMDVDVDAGSSALSREAESHRDAAPTKGKDKGKGKETEKEKGKEPEQAAGGPSGTVASDQTATAPTTPAATSTAKRGASTGRRRGRGGKKRVL
ncbi:hypothetical protein V8F33_004722 [Rhypophila sp. PSN 637]